MDANMGDGMGIGSETNVSTNNKQNHVDHNIYGLTDSTSPTAGNFGMASAVSAIRGRSKVWNEFTVTPDGKKVTCRLCGDCLAYSNSHSTSSMLKHLKRKHNLDLYPPVNEDESGNPLNTERFNRTSPSAADKRNRPKPKKHIPKDAEEIDTSVQHGPLLFKDPCVRMKWTDHSDTFLRTFSSLYSDESYTDVTLVAEKHYFKAHRVILSSASEFFDETFKMTPAGQHPIIFVKDVKAMDLRILLDFIYKGEVSIPPSLIPGLVKVGSDLRVRGLSDFVWNEQLANNIFQPQPQSSQTTPNG
ncbi:Longitudinals lacking protein, isoforms A/B/D/L [Orchesella cincta]|uniref:Longitudinals lacking protein, isoforms A/B/D/L n=1 Tax=Orchesella cincta TaxID=48709 RepID=A0A1D2MZR6_ORCCI|nr:Longitudinals lacking protein, isoforms A/B/D/L [Orchesella cincta]